MRMRTTVHSVLAIAILFSARAYAAPASGKLPMTTSSAEAKTYLEQALANIDNFQMAQARELLNKATAADSQFALAYYFAGTIAQSREEGSKLIDKALLLSHNASEGERLFIEAMAASRSGDKARAAAILAQLSTKLFAERRIFTALAQVRYELKQYDDAIVAVNTAIKLDPTLTSSYTLRGHCYLFKGDHTAARENYREAIRKTPKERSSIGSYYALAHSYLYEGQPDSALAALDLGLADYQDRVPQGTPVFIWNSKARINLENGRLDEAMRCYQNGYSLVPGSSLPADQKQLWLGRFHHGLGRTLARMGKHTEAQAHADTLKMMIETNGEAGKQYWPSYHYLVGYIKLESGDPAQALAHFQQADQSDHFIKWLLARTYETTGDNDKARTLLEEIVNQPETGLDRALIYWQAKSKLGMHSAK